MYFRYNDSRIFCTRAGIAADALRKHSMVICINCFVGQVGCGRSSDKEMMDCMRFADAGRLTAEQWNVAGIGPELTSAFRPTVDGQFIRRAPADLLAAGEFQKKSIIAGANRNEGIYFLIYLFKVMRSITIWRLVDCDDCITWCVK